LTISLLRVEFLTQFL